jgi:glycosyltransferase involved in cell wall biosynthesis
MERYPLVSVLIPCYNVSAFVEKAIISVLNQTYSNLEILIIDDASSDDTLNKIRKFKDGRIKVIEFKENTQKVGAVNATLKMAHGDLICFQDADDWSEPKRIEKQVQHFIEKPELGICFTCYRYAGEKKGSPRRVSMSYEELKNEFLDYGCIKQMDFHPTICATMMITKVVLNKTKGYHPYFVGRVAEDTQWIYRILKDFTGLTVDEVLYNYVVRKGSLTQIQFSGSNVKAAYSWQLLAKIIYKDFYENFDLLDADNVNELKAVELQACEEALVEQIQRNHKISAVYENSTSFKIGKIVLTPFLKLSGLRKYFK